MDASTRAELPEYASRLIRFKARQLIGRYGFVRSDRADLEQEFVVHLLERWPKYDPNRSNPDTFVSRLIDRKIASMIRYQRAGKRDYRHLQRSPKSGAATGQPDDVAFDRRFADSGSCTLIEHVDVALDVATLKDTLDPIERLVCEQPSVASIAEISVSLQLPQTAVRAHIVQIRRRFLLAGIAQPN